MTLYANFVPNPSFETGTTGWTTSAAGVTLTRTTNSPTAGSQVLRVSYPSTGSGDRAGAQATITIQPGQSSYTLSATIRDIAENHGNQHNTGIRVTVSDVLPGQDISQRQQLAQQTFTAAGRIAVRGFTPRPTADRLVIQFTSSSSYYKAPQTNTQSTGRVWTFTSVASGGGGISNPAGTQIDVSEWDAYRATWTLSDYGTFIYFSGITSFNAKYGTFTRVTGTTPAVNGGTVSWTIDAVQVEAKATESAYVDGTSAGYVWSGTAHASPTLGLAQIESTATASSTGGIVFGLILPMELAAAASSTGSLEATRVGLELIALATSSGGLDVWNYGPVSATATAASAGTIVMAAIVEIEMAGTASSEGSAQALIAVVSQTVAQAVSTGAIDIGLPPEASATAFAISSGTLQAAIAGVTSARAFAESIGMIEVLQAVPVGALADFAIYGITETDPRKSITTGGNGGINTGASGSEWVRVHAEFTVPDEVTTSTGTLWRHAAFVVPGIRFSALPAGSWQEFTSVQLELATPDAEPTTYLDGASVRTLVYPDRLNLAPATITVVDNAGPTFTEATPVTSPITDDDAPALQLELEPETDYSVYATLDRLKPMAAYTISAYIALDGLDDVGFYIRDPETGESLADTVTYTEGVPAPDLVGEFRRVSTTFIVPITGTAAMTFTWTDEITSTATITLAGILVEEGPEVGDYFANTGTDPEIRYHRDFEDHAGGVFHYQDSARKTYILTEALKEHVPAGIGVNPPEFDLIPHYDI